MPEDVENSGERQSEENPAEDSAAESEKNEGEGEGAVEDKEDKPDVPASIEQAAEKKVATITVWATCF